MSQHARTGKNTPASDDRPLGCDSAKLDQLRVMGDCNADDVGLDRSKGAAANERAAGTTGLGRTAAVAGDRGRRPESRGR